MSLEASKRALAKATARDLEDFKKWLDIDPVTANTPFFAPENAAKWAVLEQWHTYRMNRRHEQRLALSHSGGTTNGSPDSEHIDSENGYNDSESTRTKPEMGNHVPLRDVKFQHDNNKRLVEPQVKTGPEVEVIEISSDEELLKDENNKSKSQASPLKKRTLSNSATGPPNKRRITLDTTAIEILDSDDESMKAIPTKAIAFTDTRPVPPVKVEIDAEKMVTSSNEAAAAKDKDGRYIVTQKVKVDSIENIQEVPARWPIPPEGSNMAYVIDLNNDKKWQELDPNSKKKQLDRFIKQEDQDSWGKGTNGSSNHPIPIRFLENLPTRRSVHQCNGARCCEKFDGAILRGYVRNDAYDMTVMQEIFAGEQKQNEGDGATAVAMTEIFYRLIQGTKCKKFSCNGVPVLRALKEAPNVHGKSHFIGCTQWRAGENFEHLYAPIPASVNETILFQLMNNDPITSDEVRQYEGSCFSFRHPRHGKQKKCTHTHFHNGTPLFANMVEYKCEAKRIIYTSLDINKPIIILIFEGRHNHPPWPAEKVTQEAKEDLQKCLDTYGIYGATAEKLDNAQSTIAILGMPLSSKHHSFRNKRMLQEGVHAQKKKEAPVGLQWNGVVDRYDKDLKTLKPEERYIWHLRMDGNIKVVVTAHHILVALVHGARFLVCDYTFKRTNGELNEWEVAIWHGATNERVTVARVYSNSATKEAFGYIWEGFFNAVKTATGKGIKFKVFDDSGNIQCVILDMEAAQVQGLGAAITRMKMNDPSISQITEVEPDVLVQYLIKLCYVHWDRGTEKLIGSLGRDVVDYLNKFRALDSLVDIAAWKKFCKEHPSKDLQDWYTHKIGYPWLLPGFNRLLSHIPEKFWDSTPGHSNLVETAHVATNRNTNIQLTPLEAVENLYRARVFDTRVAESIVAASKTCIPRNINNSEKARMSRNLGRQAHRTEQNTIHRKLDSDIADTRSLLNASAETAKDLKAQLKELIEKKKEVGKAPRNIHATSNKFNIPIPKIGGDSLSATTNAAFKHNPTHNNLSPGITVFQPPVPNDLNAPTPSQSASGELGSQVLPSDAPYNSEEAIYHPGFQLPPLDLDLLYTTLENGPIAEPTAEEVSAYQFLKNALGK